MNRRQHEPGRRAGDVPRHTQRKRLQPRGRLDGDGGFVGCKRHAHGGEHALRVVAGALGLGEACLAIGIEPGEQHGRLHLRARDGACIVDRAQTAAADGERRERVRFARDDRRAHPLQGRYHPAHGPRPKGCIAAQHAQDRLARKEAAEKAHRGAAVAAVEHVVRFEQPVEPTARDPGGGALVRPIDLDAERAEAVRGGPHILGVEDAFHGRGPRGDCVQNQRPVGERLIWRHLDGRADASSA